MSAKDKTATKSTSKRPSEPIHDPGPEVAGKRAQEVLEAAVDPIDLPDGGATVRLGTASWTDPTMRERARVLGGDFLVSSEPSGGTAVQLDVPLRSNVTSPWRLPATWRPG